MNLPSRVECEAWDQAQVAFFMCKIQMSECIPTVNRLRINGQRLLNLSDSDMSKFCLIHQPQLQKIVQDIKKNDGSLLDKLRRLKSKPLPKVPARDYRVTDNERGDDDQLSEAECDNDTYEDLLEEQDDNYEPPPSHRVFTSTCASFPKGEYLDSCRNRPEQPPRKPRKPICPAKATKPLPPEPTQLESDEEDYINPDGDNDDNYIKPTEKPLANHLMHGGNRGVLDHPMLSTPLPERPPCPDFYEVPDKEENSPPVSRLCPIPIMSHACPPIPSPRMNMKSSATFPEPTGDDEYEVCDPDESSCTKSAQNPPHIPPKPLPKERSPKPALRVKLDLKQREFEIGTLPIIHNEQNHPVKAHSLDLKRPKIPLPHLLSLPMPGQNDKGNVSAENGQIDQDKEADVCNKLWYAGACDRKTADDVLHQTNKDGAFLVRKSSGHDTQQPYTLVVFYNGKVYNIPIRFLQTTQQYALGREKKGEEHFNSVSHIIENHQRTSLVLIDIQSNSKDAIRLCYPVLDTGLYVGLVTYGQVTNERKT